MSSSLPSPEELTSKLFSFVIIGGGTAGLVLAARLTEDPNSTVLVLEAGENRLDVKKYPIFTRRDLQILMWFLSGIPRLTHRHL